MAPPRRRPRNLASSRSSPPAVRRPRLLFAKVPEAKSGKNRLHLDIRAGGDRSTPPDERWEKAKARVVELEKLGATKVREMDEGAQGRWIVMQDPEGNEFCVT
jgi:hypothetical protein